MGKPKFTKWLNPYIDKVESWPELLAPCFDRHPSEEELRPFLEKKEKYQKVLCELCSGSGKHLVELASRNPDALCVGFELRYKRAYKSAEKAQKRTLSNFFVFRSNAHLITELFGKNFLDGLYINFPDPWDKRRWDKNRLLSENFVKEIFEALRPNGFFSYKTDHVNRFREAYEMLEKMPEASIEFHCDDLHKSPQALDNIETDFEGLFRSKRMPISMLIARKRFS